MGGDADSEPHCRGHQGNSKTMSRDIHLGESIGGGASLLQSALFSLTNPLGHVGEDVIYTGLVQEVILPSKTGTIHDSGELCKNFSSLQLTLNLKPEFGQQKINCNAYKLWNANVKATGRCIHLKQRIAILIRSFRTEESKRDLKTITCKHYLFSK